ncbi:MAG: MFS transporter [Acidobacteria bacterium]|nr:MFS transporter [Acidobacteriota bacterium]MCI0723913.1 MFS transporter [Acidobacteriota bacterium]
MTGRAFWICAFLFLATVLNYLDRQTLSIAAPLIQKEFALDNAQIGALLSAFFYSYALMQLAAGWLLDRVSMRWGYALAVGCWSVAVALTGLAQTFWQFVACRLLLGAFEAANWPAAARVVTAITVPKDRAFANGIFTSGSSVGAIIAPVGMVWLFRTLGWRVGFGVVGSLGFLWMAAWLLWTRRRSLETAPRTLGREAVAKHDDVSWSLILRTRHFYGILVASAFANACLHFYTTWVALYLVQTYGLHYDAQLSAFLLLVYVGLDIGYLGGGAAVLPLVKRGYEIQTARQIVLVAGTALMTAAAAIPWLPSPTTAAAVLCLVNIGRGAWGANFFTFTQEISPHKVAMLTGISGCVGALAGALFVWLVGVVSGRAGFTAPFILLGIMPVLATAPLLLTRWRQPALVHSGG